MLSFLLAPFFAWLSAAPPPAPGVRPADVEFCKIYGAVYLERDDRYRPFCSFIAYEEPNDALADLHVFREDNKLFADQPGLWYITPTKAFADYVVFVTPERGFADFSIYYTTARSFAGCRR